MEAHIQYVAIRSERPEKLADFYKDHFEMSEVAHSKEGNIALTDGFYNLSILKIGENDRTSGFSHIGVAIDDLHELVGRVEKFAAPTTRLLAEEGDVFHGDYRIHDPNGMPVSVSLNNFGLAESEPRLPSIHHIALSVPNNQAVLDFFMNVFGFRQQIHNNPNDTRPVNENTSRGAADGVTAFQILRYPVTTSDVDPSVKLGIRHTRWGVNHLGWLVPDLDLTLKSLPEETVHQRPSSRPMAEFRGYDPDGNEFDISFSKGYQVDQKVWAKAS
jgi:catechol 2,3-dioxygenase-like lactoylglutathione lyase family enzyme